MPKHFVLDTNVLLHSAAAMDRFADNVVVIPLTVIEELDNFKKKSDELGRNAREVIRRLDRLRMKKGASLRDGVPTPRGGTVKVLAAEDGAAGIPLERPIADNRIIAVAYRLQQAGETVVIVSKDANVRVKASLAGLAAEDYDDNFEHRASREVAYTGHRRAAAPDAATLAALEKGGEAPAPLRDLSPNEGVILDPKSDDPAVPVARARPNHKMAFFNRLWEGAWTLSPRSPEQTLAFGLLHDPDVALVTLSGQAGTGKTLLALAVGLESVVRAKRYEKLLVSRPIMPLGRDIGFLPGDKDDKLNLWMQPIYDNLAFLMGGDEKKDAAKKGGRADGGDRPAKGEKVKTDPEKRVDDLLKRGVVELEAITYIRGRSIPRKYVVVDEAQNLTPHEVKTIISRAGEGTKIVLTGDPEQIDNPYLDRVSNGLSVTIERFRHHPLAGHVTLAKTERSPLAALAAQLL